MAPSAGGSVPEANSDEYNQWVGWIQQKQQEFAVRGFWRRCLTREEIVVSGDTTVLPDRFHKPNGLYVLQATNSNGEVEDWCDPDNKKVSVEMINDPEDSDFGKWQMRFPEPVPQQTVVIWYFANPPVPTQESDILLLPGDMVGFAALSEYFRTTGAEGSQDDARAEGENRFQEYISLELIPDRSELITVSRKRIDRIAYQKQFYYRPNRHTQGW